MLQFLIPLYVWKLSLTFIIYVQVYWILSSCFVIVCPCRIPPQYLVKSIYFLIVTWYRTINGGNLTFQSSDCWLNGDWTATEWWLERQISVAFSANSVTIQSTEWMHIFFTFQSYFQLSFFWKTKSLQMTGSKLGPKTFRESILTF